MRIYFTVGMFLIVFLITGLLGYGIYLNQRGENQIAQRMEDRRLPLEGATAKMRDMAPQMDMELVSLYTDDMTDVVALSNGRITQELVEKNSHVEAGTPILSLLDEDIPLKLRQSDSDILDAEAQLLKARNSYERYQQLVSVSAVSKEKYDEAAAAYTAARARLANYQAQREQLRLQESRQTVTSPIAGEVLMLYQKPGSYVTAGTAVALVGDFSHLRFSAPVEDKYASRMQMGDVIEITVHDSAARQKPYGAKYAEGNQGDQQIFLARMVKITPDLSEPAKLRQVVWEIDNSMGILEPGVYSKFVLRPRVIRRALAVPLTAMVDKTKSEVAVLTPERTLKLVKVETGVTDGTYIEIVAGLQEGDVVITSDTEGLKEGTPIEVSLEEDGNEG